MLDLYGAEPGKASFANNCLLARRLAERGVRFVQLYHRDWDHHGNLPKRTQAAVRRSYRPGRRRAVKDLKQRGLLDDTLVIWGGEFGRTAYSQGAHHARTASAATIIRAASPSGWPAAASSPASPTARPTTSATTWSKTRPRPRPPGDDPAPAGHRPQAADLPLPGPRLPPDRRRTAKWCEKILA